MSPPVTSPASPLSTVSLPLVSRRRRRSDGVESAPKRGSSSSLLAFRRLGVEGGRDQSALPGAGLIPGLRV